LQTGDSLNIRSGQLVGVNLNGAMVIVDNCRFGEKIEHRRTRADDTDPVSQEVVLDIGIGVNCYFSFHGFYLPLNRFWERE
jgi:hypothetical protein